MGMFNTVDVICECPICEASLDGAQTKDDTNRPLFCDDVQVEEVSHFYAKCIDCDVWIEWYRTGKNRFVPYTFESGTGKDAIARMHYEQIYPIP